jgi:hypothetical protein
MKECGNTKKPRKPKESMVSARHECILIPKRKEGDAERSANEHRSDKKLLI